MCVQLTQPQSGADHLQADNHSQHSVSRYEHGSALQPVMFFAGLLDCPPQLPHFPDNGLGSVGSPALPQKDQVETMQLSPDLRSDTALRLLHLCLAATITFTILSVVEAKEGKHFCTVFPETL